MRSTYYLALAALTASPVLAQSFQRLGGCPSLGCVFPPDQAEMLAGAKFDIRIEVHAPVNGSEAYNGGVPDTNFSLTIDNNKGYVADVSAFFQYTKTAPALERWNFTYFEDFFARDAKTPTVVNVASKAYRTLSLYEPGNYTATLKFWDQTTVARWTVRAPAPKPLVKNVILFIGDGMPQSAITAARLLAHKQINGKYQTTMQLDKMDGVGLQMTHSIDSFITDSANSATAIMTGHKSTVNALGVYVDSSPDPFDDPKIETIAELFHRQRGGKIGIVSTAFLADATPASLIAHTRDRGTYAPIAVQYLNGVVSNYSDWTTIDGPDVLFGGGAEQWIAGSGSPGRQDYYKAFQAKGYKVVNDKDQLAAADTNSKTLGLFSQSNMAKWIDREIFPENLPNITQSPTGNGSAVNQPGLAEMTIKAIDILKCRDEADGTKGFFLMSEAASIDKMFHAMDYDRALGELLELDDTVRKTLEHLEKIGKLDETLVIVTADHAHGFDVFGSSDTQYMKAQTNSRTKRSAIGIYEQSGHSEYQVAKGSRPENQTIVYGEQGPNFPVQWDPRYTIAAGFGAHPDAQEDYSITKNGPRLPAIRVNNTVYANPADKPQGYLTNGTIPTDQTQGIHSLQDVPIFTKGKPEAVAVFRGVMQNTDIFFHMATVLGLGSTERP